MKWVTKNRLASFGFSGLHFFSYILKGKNPFLSHPTVQRPPPRPPPPFCICFPLVQRYSPTTVVYLFRHYNLHDGRTPAELVSHSNACMNLFPQHSISSSAPLFPVQTKQLWIRGESSQRKSNQCKSCENGAPVLWSKPPNTLHRARDTASFWRRLKSHLI